MQRMNETIQVFSDGSAFINGEAVDGVGRPIRFNHRGQRSGMDDRQRRFYKEVRRDKRHAAAQRARVWRRCWERMRGPDRRLALNMAAVDHAEKECEWSNGSYKESLLLAMCKAFGIFRWPIRSSWDMDPKLCLHCDGEGGGKLRDDDCQHWDIPF